jgi:hypothetical protein
MPTVLPIPTRRLAGAALFLAAAAAGCGDDRTRLRPSYVLTEVDGGPPPFVYAVAGDPEGDRTEYRIVGRALAFGPGRTVRYQQLSDALTITGAGADTTFAIECHSATGAYSVEGDLVILSFLSPGGTPELLEIEGARLAGQVVTALDAVARIYYEPGATTADCGV